MENNEILTMIKNILIITTNFPPATSIGTQRILKLCKYLDRDWNIHVLTLKEKYYPNGGKSKNISGVRPGIKVWRTGRFDLFPILIGLKNRIVISKKNSEKPSIYTKSDWSVRNQGTIKAKMRKVGSFITDLLEFPDQDISWVPFSVIKGLHILKNYRVDVIFSSAPRHSNLITATILKKITKKKMIIDFRDPWARSPWMTEKKKENRVERLKDKLIQSLEKVVVETADQIIFTTQALRDEFINHYFYLPQKKFSVFYTGYDPDRLELNESLESSYRRRKLKENKIVFSHIGSLYKKRNPEKLIRAIESLIRENKLDRKTFLFRFIGNISRDLDYINDIIIQKNLQDVISNVPPISYNESFKYMKESDVLVILQPEATLMLPAKFFDYICFDKPILALGKKGGEVEKAVHERFGLFVDYDNLNDIQNGILNIIDTSNGVKYPINEHRKFFDTSHLIKDLEEIIKNT